MVHAVSPPAGHQPPAGRLLRRADRQPPPRLGRARMQPMLQRNELVRVGWAPFSLRVDSTGNWHWHWHAGARDGRGARGAGPAVHDHVLSLASDPARS